MKHNAYIAKISKDLHNTISQLKDLDRGQRNNFTTRTYPFSHVDDAFNTFFELFDATPGEIVTAFDYNSQFADLLFSSWYEQNSLRLAWVDKFLDVIGSRIELFSECLSVCLSSHDKVRHEYAQEFRDENFVLFKKLISIGEKYDVFSTLEQKELYSQDTLYQNYLIEKGLLKTEFDQKQLFDVLDTYALNSNKRSDLSKRAITDLLSTYAKDIVDLINHSDLVSIIFDKGQFALFIDSFFEQNYTQVNSQELQTAAFKLLNYSVGQEHILSSLHKKPFLLKHFGTALIDYLEALPEHRRKQLFTIEQSFDDSAIRYDIYMSSKIQALFNCVFSEEQLRRPYGIVSEAVANYYIHQIKHYNEAHAEEKQKTQFYLGSWLAALGSYSQAEQFDEAKIISQHSELMTYGIYPTWPQSVANLKRIKLILKQVHEAQPNSGYSAFSVAQFSKKLNTQIQQQFYQAFTQEKNIEYRKKNSLIEQLSYCIEHFPDAQVMDVLSADEQNPIWATFLHDQIYDTYSTASKKTMTKTRYDYPLVYMLTEQSKGKALLAFFDSEKLPALAALKYKGKNIVNYFIQNMDQSFQQKLLETVATSPEAIKLLIIENKPALKMVEMAIAQFPDNATLQSMLNFGKLTKMIEKSNDKQDKTQTFIKPRKI